MGNEIAFCCSTQRGGGGGLWSEDDDLLFAAPERAREDPVKLQLRALGEGSPRRCVHVGEACSEQLAGMARRATALARRKSDSSTESASTLTSKAEELEADSNRELRAFAGPQATRVLTTYELGTGRFATSIWRIEPVSMDSLRKVSSSASGQPLRRGHLRLEACTLSPADMRFHCSHLFHFGRKLLLAVAASLKSDIEDKSADTPTCAIRLYSLEQLPAMPTSLENSLCLIGELWASATELRGHVVHIHGHQGTLVCADEHGSLVIWKLQMNTEDPHNVTSSSTSAAPFSSSDKNVSISGIPSHVEQLDAPVVALQVRGPPAMGMVNVFASPSGPFPATFPLSGASGHTSEIAVVTSSGSVRGFRFSWDKGAAESTFSLRSRASPTDTEETQDGAVSAVAFAPQVFSSQRHLRNLDGQHTYSLVFVASHDGSLCVYDLRKPMDDARIAVFKCENPIRNLAFGAFSNGPLVLGESNSQFCIRKMDLGGSYMPTVWRPGYASKQIIVEPGHAVFALSERGHVLKID